MAKSTIIDKNPTVEEKLSAIIIPTNNQEFDIPSNWRWVLLGKCAGIKRGASPRPIKSYITEDEDGVNWIKIGDTDSGKYVSQTKERITKDGARKSVFVKKGTLLLSNSMSFGRPYILNVEGCIHDGWLAITPNIALDKEYLYYALLASDWYFERVAVGTAVRNLNSDRVGATPIPLPPLPEQQRIVDRIESLFAKLDEAKEKAQAVVDGFDQHISQIRRIAFSGELTALWRKESGIENRGWNKQELRDYLSLITYGFTNPMPDSEVGPWKVTAKNVQNGYIDYSTSRKTTHLAYENDLTDKSKPIVNDVLLTKDGSIGRVAVVDREGICINQSVALLRPKGSIRPQFLQELLLSPDYQQIMESQSGGTALKHIYITRIDKMVISVPEIDEQDEVIRLLSLLLEEEQQAKESAEQVVAQIDTMKKAILARAFRGELGTNDPGDESAEELLKTILKKGET